MDDHTRNLILRLTSHMSYMQGQLEAYHDLDDLDDFYWYRESVALRQQVADALAADEPAVPEGREPAAVVGEPSDEEIMELIPPQMHEDFAFAARAMANEAGTDSQKAKGFMRIALNRHAVDLALAVLARFGNHFPDAKKMVGPAPAPVTDDDLDLLVIAIQALRPKASPGSHDLAAVDRGTEILRKWLAARGMA